MGLLFISDTENKLNHPFSCPFTERDIDHVAVIVGIVTGDALEAVTVGDPVVAVAATAVKGKPAGPAGIGIVMADPVREMITAVTSMRAAVKKMQMPKVVSPVGETSHLLFALLSVCTSESALWVTLHFLIG